MDNSKTSNRTSKIASLWPQAAIALCIGLGACAVPPGTEVDCHTGASVIPYPPAGSANVVIRGANAASDAYAIVDFFGTDGARMFHGEGIVHSVSFTNLGMDVTRDTLDLTQQEAEEAAAKVALKGLNAFEMSCRFVLQRKILPGGYVVPYRLSPEPRGGDFLPAPTPLLPDDLFRRPGQAPYTYERRAEPNSYGSPPEKAPSQNAPKEKAAPPKEPAREPRADYLSPFMPKAGTPGPSSLPGQLGPFPWKHNPRRDEAVPQ